MSYFVAFTHGPGYLEIFLDMLSIILLSDIIAILLLIRICCKGRKKEGQVIQGEYETVTAIATTSERKDLRSSKLTAITTGAQRKSEGWSTEISTQTENVEVSHKRTGTKTQNGAVSRDGVPQRGKDSVEVGTNTEENDVRVSGETSNHLANGVWINVTENTMTSIKQEETVVSSESAKIELHAERKLDGKEISTQTDPPFVVHKETSTTGWQHFSIQPPIQQERILVEIGTNTEKLEDGREDILETDGRKILDVSVDIAQSTTTIEEKNTLQSTTVESSLLLNQKFDAADVSTQTDESLEPKKESEPESEKLSVSTQVEEEARELTDNWTSTEEVPTNTGDETNEESEQAEKSTQTSEPSVADTKVDANEEPKKSFVSSENEEEVDESDTITDAIIKEDQRVTDENETELVNITRINMTAITEETTEQSTTVTTKLLIRQLHEGVDSSTQTEVHDEGAKDDEEGDTSSISVQTEGVDILEGWTQTDEVKKEETINIVEAVVPRPPLKRGKSRDDITFLSGWRRTVKLTDLMEARLIMETRVEELEREEITEADVARDLAPFLVGTYPIAGVIINETGQKMSLHKAYKTGIISRGTAISLLEAQAAVGSIINPADGAKMSVEEAKNNGLLDKSFAAVLARAERAVTGFKPRGSNETLSLFQAMQRELIVEGHGIRLLEAQIATGGIIDPQANVRLPVEVAFERGLFDERLHRILEDPSDDTKGFLDPNTQENLTYLELIKRCVVDKHTGLLLLPLVTKEEWQDYKERHSSASSAGKSRTFSGQTSSTGGSVGGVEDLH